MMELAEINKYKVSDKEKLLVIPHFLGETLRMNSVLPRVFLDESTFNPDADPESTSVDGRCSRTVLADPAEAWATIIAGAGNSGSATSAGASGDSFIFRAGTNNNTWYILGRSIFLFDSSSLTASATISGAIFSINGTAKANDASNTPTINVYSSNPASNTAIADADHNTIGSTAFSTAKAYADMNTAGYNDFTLNATGLAAISKTGITKFGTREATYDVGTTQPLWGGDTKLTVNYADNGSNKPKLVVTFTLPSATVATGFFHFM
jgi:hypothetical protein